MLGHENGPVIGKHTLDGQLAGGHDPADDIQGIGLALMLGTNFLQVIKEPRLARPDTPRGMFQDRRQRALPFGRVLFT